MVIEEKSRGHQSYLDSCSWSKILLLKWSSNQHCLLWSHAASVSKNKLVCWIIELDMPVLQIISDVNKPLTLLDIIKSDLAIVVVVWFLCLSIKVRVTVGLLTEHVWFLVLGDPLVFIWFNINLSSTTLKYNILFQIKKFLSVCLIYSYLPVCISMPAPHLPAYTSPCWTSACVFLY